MPRPRRARRSTRARSVSRLEAIAHAGLRDDERRTHGIAFDLPAQTANVDAEVLLRVPVRVSPDFGEQLPVRQRASRMPHENAEQVPLGARQMYRRSVTREGRL